VRPVDALYAPAYALAIVALYRLNRIAARAAGYLDAVVLAESTGLIGDLGSWVLGQAVAGTAALNTAAGRPVFVDINVSAAQFGSG